MIQKPINKIEEEDLKMLIKNKILENKTLEYKSGSPLLDQATDKERKEFYKDISSFANAEDGDIIYGISTNQKTRFPEKIDGFTCNNVDDLTSSLSSMIRTGIEPVIIPEPEMWPISLQNGKIALIIRVHNSIMAPHWVSYKGYKRFYIRANNRSVEMSIEDIRNSFNLSLNIIERIQKFRMERLQKLLASDTPIPLSKNFKGKMMLHLIPLQSFSSTQYIDINNESNRSIIDKKLKPIETRHHYYKYNLDGFLTHANTNENNETYSYVQFFKNGIIEAVFGAAFDEGKLVVEYIKNITSNNAYNYLNLLKDLNVSLPVYIFLTLCEIKGYTMLQGSNTSKIDRDILQLPDVVVDRLVNNENELGAILKPIFDAIWNAGGHQAL